MSIHVYGFICDMNKETCALRPAAAYPPPYQDDKGVNTAGRQGGTRGGQGEDKGRTG